MNMLRQIAIASLLTSCSPSPDAVGEQAIAKVRTSDAAKPVEPPAVSTETATEAGLVCSTNPPGATIYIDGTPWLEKTPTVVHIPPGSYEIRYELVDYQVARLEEIVVRNQVRQLRTIDLQSFHGPIPWSDSEVLGKYHVIFGDTELLGTGELRISRDDPRDPGIMVGFKCNRQISQEQIAVLLSRGQMDELMTYLRLGPTTRAPPRDRSDASLTTTTQISIQAYQHRERRNVTYYNAANDPFRRFRVLLARLAQPCQRWLGSDIPKLAASQFMPCVEAAYGSKAESASFRPPIAEYTLDPSSGTPVEIHLDHGPPGLKECLARSLKFNTGLPTGTSPTFRWRLKKYESPFFGPDGSPLKPPSR